MRTEKGSMRFRSVALVWLFSVVLGVVAEPLPEPAANTLAPVAQPLPNAGFEAGETGWSIRKDNGSLILADAARTGKLGLRVATTPPSPLGSSAHSARLAAAPGNVVTVTFWARSHDAFCGVYLLFYTKEGKAIGSADRGSDGKPTLCAVGNSGGEWKAYALAAVAPAGTASAGVWVHAFSQMKGLADFDDFSLTGVSPGTVVTAPRARAATSRPASIPDRPRDPGKPQVVILKMDDLTQNGARREQGEAVSWRLKKFVDTVRRLKVKASLGIIGESLAKGDPAYFGWIRSLHDEGLIEIWNHGYTHQEYPKENGRRRSEFAGNTLEEQKENLGKTQRLAKEKLGFELAAFGSPFNLVDGTTEKAIEAFPEITVWFFGPDHPKGPSPLILQRTLNLESPVTNPDSAQLVEAYERYGKNLDCLVLQGHPNAWNDGKIAEFERAVTYLKGKGCVFMTPSEFYRLQKSDGPRK